MTDINKEAEDIVFSKLESDSDGFESLNKEEENLEIERCQESFAYFYNNYCKREGMREYSEDVFKDYLQQVEKERNRVNRRKFGESYFFPLTYQETLKRR